MSRLTVPLIFSEEGFKMFPQLKVPNLRKETILIKIFKRMNQWQSSIEEICSKLSILSLSTCRSAAWAWVRWVSGVCMKELRW